MFEVRDLRFAYPGNAADTLRGLNFEVQTGEIFGLLGPSGVGKSTTQKIMVKLLGNYRGEVTYEGRDLKSYGREFYQEIGVGFEMPVHFSKLTASENIEFFKKLYRTSADTDALMKRVGLYEDRDRKVSEYSKGMKIRLNFVRAMLNRPRMLFLDEPTMGLDPKNSRIIKDIIREFREDGATVLLTTHLMNDVDELCDRVAFMVDGRIAEIDSPKSLKVRHGQRTVEVEYRGEGGVETTTFEMDTLGSDQRFLDIIRNRELVTIHSKETNLDDIFIEVTGVEHHE
ncbi:MAG: ABC transporter ATP-binding protein [Bacillota bacterium]